MPRLTVSRSWWLRNFAPPPQYYGTGAATAALLSPSLPPLLSSAASDSGAGSTCSAGPADGEAPARTGGDGAEQELEQGLGFDVDADPPPTAAGLLLSLPRAAEPGACVGDPRDSV